MMSAHPALPPALSTLAHPFASLSGLKACVDLGGTKVAVSLANASGMHAKRTEPTAKEGTNDALARQIIRMMGESCLQAGFKQQYAGYSYY